MLSLKLKESSAHTHGVKMSQVTERMSPLGEKRLAAAFVLPRGGGCLNWGVEEQA